MRLKLPMSDLAWRNLVHDKVRLGVTLTGIVFAVVLIVVELGLFVGFTTTTSGLIDRSNADLWITSARVGYVEVGVPFSERKLYTVLSTPGVKQATKYIVRFAIWKRPDGRQESVQVIGLDPDQPMGGPWNLASGTQASLKEADNIIIDELYKEKLGITRLGQIAEINGRRARVVGFTSGIRSFTTSPYVFTSFKSAQDYSNVAVDQTLFLLVKVAEGTDVATVQKALAARLPDSDVHTAAEFSGMTRSYWMFTTGAGVAVLLAAALGLVVGVVVVAQTIYATTMDHLREYGTLKAIGANNSYLYRVIIQQAVASALLGYVLAMIVSYFVVRGSQSGGAAILVPMKMVGGMFVLTVVMCVGAALVSINKVTRLDPAMVFKG
ncbi:MAG: FtsX-like permease family protein [Vicinamibacterales bacterium]